MSRSLRENYSLISRDASANIKGFLIILIVLGHNMAFTIPLDEWGIMSYLYTFHVHIFFLLPYLYGSKAIVLSRVRDYIFRYYWPYLVLSLIFSFVFGCVNCFEHCSWVNYLRLLLVCSSDDIRTLCGVSFLWFLPAMMMNLFLRDLYYQSSVLIRYILLLISGCISLLSILNMSLTLPIVENIFQNLPFGLQISASYLLLGVMGRKLITKHQLSHNIRNVILCCILLILGTYIYATEVSIHMNREVMWFKILQLTMPFPVMLILCQLFDSLKGKQSRIIRSLGDESLLIYLISPFVGYVCYFILCSFDAVCWETGILIQLLIIYISYKMSILCPKQIKSIFFPHSYDDFKTNTLF